jgi:hypothetical protein
MHIVVALIGAAATIVAAVISVRANRTNPSSSAAVGGISGAAIPKPAKSRAGIGAAPVAARVAGAATAFVLSALALATLINVIHDVDSGASSLGDVAVIIGMVFLVAAIAVLWNLARLLMRPVGARSSLRSTLLLAVNIVTYGGVLAMMAGLWQR